MFHPGLCIAAKIYSYLADAWMLLKHHVPVRTRFDLAHDQLTRRTNPFKTLRLFDSQAHYFAGYRPKRNLDALATISLIMTLDHSGNINEAHSQRL